MLESLLICSPSYILLKDGLTFINPIRVWFWPLHSKCYSCKHESNEITTCPRAKAPPPRPIPSFRVHMFFLIHTTKGWTQVHMFINPILVLFGPLHSKWYRSKYESNEMTDPTKSRSISTKPRPCYRIHMFFLIHTPIGWIQVYIFTNPISVLFRPLHSIFYSSTKYESSEMTDPTKTSSTPTKTQTMLQSLNVLPDTYY
jgi:hypothetical protein